MRQNPLKKVLATLVLSAACLLAVPVQAQEPSMQQVQQMEAFLGLMNEFFGIIESLHEVSDDPEKAAIFQLHKIQEAYEENGNKIQAARVLRDVLENSTNRTIRAAAFLMLGDLLKEHGQREEAIEVLRRGLQESLRNAN